MNDCIFCNIANKSAPAQIYYEDEHVLVIQDILPKAPVHLLVLPREHIVSVNDLKDSQAELVGRMVLIGKRLAQEKGVAQKGYRMIFNVGKEGGQIVPHLHMHVLGGKQLSD